MGSRDCVKLLPRLREGEKEALLSRAVAAQEKLEAERRLASTAFPLDDIEAVARKPAHEHGIEAGDPRGNGRGLCGHPSSFPLAPLSKPIQAKSALFARPNHKGCTS